METQEATTRATVGTKEAAAMLGCSEARIRRMIRAGELPAKLVPGRYGPQYRIKVAHLPGYEPPAAPAPVEEPEEAPPPVTEEQTVALAVMVEQPEEAPAAVPVPEEPQEMKREDPEVARLREECEQWEVRWGQVREERDRWQQACAEAREERDRWQQLWGQTREDLGRLSAEMEAEGRARAAAEMWKEEAEGAMRRVEGLLRQEQEARDMLEPERYRADRLTREVERLRRLVRRWAVATAIAALAAIVAIIWR